MHPWLAFLTACIPLVSACAAAPAEDAGDAGKADNSDVPYPKGPSKVILEVYALDIWGQQLVSPKLTATGPRALAPNGARLNRLALNDAGTYELTLSEEGFQDQRIEIDFSGDAQLNAVQVRNGHPHAGIAIARSQRRIAGLGEKPVVTVYMGLPHRFFAASGTPARRGNNAELLMDGEEAFQRLFDDIKAATDTIRTAVWWWEGEFELLRPTSTDVPRATREANTIQQLYDASPARKQVLLNSFIGQTAPPVTHSLTLQLRGVQSGDNFEFMPQINDSKGVFTWTPQPIDFVNRVQTYLPSSATFDPTHPIAATLAARELDTRITQAMGRISTASYHQKFHVFDDKTAYIGGMNLRRTDWDTSQHRVFDARRMALNASAKERLAVAQKTKLPDAGPRKDYSVRMQGPIVRDALAMFAKRWNFAIESRAAFANNSTAIDTEDRPHHGREGLQMQVTATTPAPFWDYAIAESWRNAISQARNYIYIEDQYFRMPSLLPTIIARMHEAPTLQLIVITKLVDKLDPGCEWTGKSDAELRKAFPNRYLPLRLRSFDTQNNNAIFVDIDVHSKMFIVDDQFMSVGSANKNDRGTTYEGELNIAIYDQNWVRAARTRIVTNLLSQPPTDNWIQQLRGTAEINEKRRVRLEQNESSLDFPQGFVYPLTLIPSAACSFRNISPDLT